MARYRCRSLFHPPVEGSCREAFGLVIKWDKAKATAKSAGAIVGTSSLIAMPREEYGTKRFQHKVGKSDRQDKVWRARSALVMKCVLRCTRVPADCFCNLQAHLPLFSKRQPRCTLSFCELHMAASQSTARALKLSRLRRTEPADFSASNA